MNEPRPVAVKLRGGGAFYATEFKEVLDNTAPADTEGLPARRLRSRVGNREGDPDAAGIRD